MEFKVQLHVCTCVAHYLERVSYSPASSGTRPVLVMQFSALNKELSSSSNLLTLTGKKIKQMQEVQVCIPLFKGSFLDIHLSENIYSAGQT